MIRNVRKDERQTKTINLTKMTEWIEYYKIFLNPLHKVFTIEHFTLRNPRAFHIIKKWLNRYSILKPIL